jgi:hypothetical protein
VLLLSNRQPLRAVPVRLFEEDLRAGHESSCLLTPTATMAEHIRHTLARRGLFVRPDSIVTLSRFVEPLIRDVPQAGPALLNRLVAQVLAVNPPECFRALAASAGLRRMLVGLIEEVSTAGGDPSDLAQPVGSVTGEAFQSVYAQVERELASRGLYLRAARLAEAARRLRAQGHPWKRIYLTGFYALTPAEIAILTALEPCEIAVSLPSTESAVETRRALVRGGFVESEKEDEPPRSIPSVFHAVSEQQEAEEIARRILGATATGHNFREIGVIVRREAPYVPLLRNTFRRYGIPARFYFQRTLSLHSVWRYLAGFLDAVEANWDYERLLPVLRMSYTKLVEPANGDEVDHKLRSRYPAAGFPPELESLRSWLTYARWRSEHHTAAEWTNELKSLRALVSLPRWTDQVPHEEALAWRELLSALDAWDTALEQVPSLFEPHAALTLAEFRTQLGEVAEHIPVDDRDQRRNVVHVLDTHEARQWSLPIVFICGLLERGFPQYHNEHPVLPDEDRARLRERGVVLRTSGERQREESVLFETAVRCATSQLVLSYPRTNSKGEETLPSFLLARFQREHELQPQPALRSRPRSKWPKAIAKASSIRDRELLAALKKARAVLSPTAIETYLQCPWQYYARHVLKLKPPPPYPHERLDFLLQGTILHETLAATEGSPLFVEELFSQLFDDACRAHSLPPSCRTEKVRIDLHGNLRRFLESPPLAGARTVGVERAFNQRLASDLKIRGKMDRVAQLPNRGLVVIDYKYSTKDRVRGRIRSHDRGELVQGGLYLWAAEKEYGQAAAGMLYCGLRGEVSWAGWHVPVFGWQDIGESWDPGQLREMMDRAVEISQSVALRIAMGEIAPEPADVKKCDWCEFRDTCRVESAPAGLVHIAGAPS